MYPVAHISFSKKDLMTFDLILHSFSFPHFVAEYYTLCPGGEGFRPNPITIILEGEYTSDGTRFKQELTLEKSW